EVIVMEEVRRQEAWLFWPPPAMCMIALSKATIVSPTLYALCYEAQGCLELPFMMMPHPLIPVSLPPASVTMAMNQMNHLSTIANMAAAAQGQSLPSRMVTSVIKERVPDSPSPAPSLEDHRRPGSHPSSHRSSSVSSSPAHTESSSDRIPIHHNGMSMNHALLGLSPNIPPGPKEGDLAHDMSHEAKRMHNEKVYKSNMHFRAYGKHKRRSQLLLAALLVEKYHLETEYSIPPAPITPTPVAVIKLKSMIVEQWLYLCLPPAFSPSPLLLLSPPLRPGREAGQQMAGPYPSAEDNPMCTPTARESYERLSFAGQALPPGFPSPFLFPDGLSSIETLLTNIQGLLKVAIDNARAQEKQVQLEKTELKMELFRERELRETLEKQLAMEQKNRAIIQKRLKKEKKAKRKLQEALEYESKRREQVEQSMKQPSPSDSMRSLNGQNFHNSLTPEMESDRSSGRTDAERTIQGIQLAIWAIALALGVQYVFGEGRARDNLCRLSAICVYPDTRHLAEAESYWDCTSPVLPGNGAHVYIFPQYLSWFPAACHSVCSASLHDP
ncbi:hypothetical protein JOQ06_030133, partial [Pogonophryne albipinna]